MRTLTILALSLLIPACGGGGGDPAPVETRSFAMGFTPFPYARTLQAVQDTWAVIGSDGDLVTFHFDDGVPWQPADEQTAYPTDYLNELNGQSAAAPPGQRRYLAITPINFLRTGLAQNRTGSGGVALTPPWDGYAFNDPHVIGAYTRHCEKMISIFHPDYMAFAVEVNLLAYFTPAKWAGFVTLAQSVYTSLKAAHPTLPIFMSLQADSYFVDPVAQGAAIAQVLPYTDFIALSAYPYSMNADPANIRPDLFSTLAAMAPSKPFAIAETGWAAEDVTAPYPQVIPETPARQQAYVEFLLRECTKLDAVFINWFMTRDYDDLWTAEIQFLPDNSLVRLWKDIGLYDGAGNPRPALATWRSTLALPRR
ncbi:MAG TPA: hypothetical protein VNM14_17245 [Planctomycetota bacterium]|nr:hypothetical protein [Planctomycetota bacterium]